VKIEFRNVIDIPPGVNFNDMYTNSPFTIIINSPKVNSIAGKDKITIIGFSIALINEKIRPASRNPVTPAVTSIL
jgi:hypothetical protein